MGGTSEPADDARASGARRWLFGAAVLDERSLELRVGGEVVSVDRKPLEVLLHLLHHAGEVVTKDELLEAVWPGRVLSDSALTSCMARLREALHDDDQTLIKTQHGYGYRLVAKVQVEAAVSPPPPRFDFKSGDHPPGRPQWKLLERLGTGGHGEVWLARNEKTRQARVFKFALDSAALVSLKREITLYRLLNDALGEKASIVEVHDWNLEQPPYFIEAEDIESGSLVTWAQAQGGLDKVTLETRLEIAAQIAEALAAAHSVGVLHKDLKPSNILVVSSPLPTDVGRGRAEGAGEGRVQIKLADFGSGGVLDTSRLEQMGITRLGFTKTIAAAGTTSGTPIYFAPEVIAGQPFTVQADIYALGVILYQLVVGDLKKSLAPGWERNIDDELLRNDIADAAEGNSSNRLPDASLLAQRLRSLDARRKQRETEMAARLEAEQQRLTVERFKARRAWIAATVFALISGLAGSLWLYRDAVAARDSALSVSGFLTQDVLSIADPFANKPKDMSVRAMIDRAGKLLNERLADQPEAAAQVHFAIGYAYRWLGEDELMTAHMKQAANILKTLYGDSDLRTLLVQMWAPETAEQKLEIDQKLMVKLERHLGPEHPQVIEKRCNLADDRFETGQITQSQVIKEFRAAIADGQRALERGGPKISPLPRASWTLFLDPPANDLGVLLFAKQNELSDHLIRAGQFQEALDVANEMRAWTTKWYSENHYATWLWRSSRARALIGLERFDEAQIDIHGALSIISQWYGEDDRYTQVVLGLFGRALRNKGRLGEAQVLQVRALEACRKKVPEADAESMGNSCAQPRQDLAETLKAQGDLEGARRLLEDASKTPVR